MRFWWDKNSFPHYRLSPDDNIFFLRDIARNVDCYTSIFDNQYLAFFQEMHRRFGTKTHFNLYYRTEDFDLSQMPDKFRREWEDNADWIRLSLQTSRSTVKISMPAGHEIFLRPAVYPLRWYGGESFKVEVLHE